MHKCWRASYRKDGCTRRQEQHCWWVWRTDGSRFKHHSHSFTNSDQYTALPATRVLSVHSMCVPILFRTYYDSIAYDTSAPWPRAMHDYTHIVNEHYFASVLSRSPARVSILSRTYYNSITYDMSAPWPHTTHKYARIMNEHHFTSVSSRSVCVLILHRIYLDSITQDMRMLRPFKARACVTHACITIREVPLFRTLRNLLLSLMIPDWHHIHSITTPRALVEPTRTLCT
jgi:hypothetical protein